MIQQDRFDPSQPRDEMGKWTDTGKSSTGRYSYNDLYQIMDSATGKLTHSLGSKRNADMVLKDLEHGAEIPENLIKSDYSGVDVKIKWYGHDNILENAQMVIESDGRKFYTGWVIGDDGRRFSFYEPAQNVVVLSPISSVRTIQRTIAQVIRDYRDKLTNAVYETLNGRTDAISMRRAHRDMIFRLGPDAYIEGLREGGVPAEELDTADRKAIRDWINEQYAHVNKFADDTVAARGDDGKRKQILSRLDMWVESMRTIGNQGLMSAQKNSMGVWRLGPTEEHCKTGNGRIGCANLHGKRHRLSWFLSRGLIPRQPGSAILGCKGYKCLCEIRGDDGSVLVPSTRAIRFDPNQPRDEYGKWTDAGGNTASNIDPKLFKTLSDQLSSLSKQYGFDIDSIESGDQLDPNHIMALRFDEETGYIALLVPNNFNTPDKITEKLDRAKSTWANSIEARTVEDVINHEYGHLLYFKAMGYSERMAIKDAFNISVKYGIGMSELGMKNEREFFAEAFLMYKRGEFIRDRDLQRALKPVYSKLAEYEK